MPISGVLTSTGRCIYVVLMLGRRRKWWPKLKTPYGPCETHTGITANMRRWTNTGLMLAQRRRRWASINPELVQRLVFGGIELGIEPAPAAAATGGQSLLSVMTLVLLSGCRRRRLPGHSDKIVHFSSHFQSIVACQGVLYRNDLYVYIPYCIDLFNISNPVNPYNVEIFVYKQCRSKGV